MIRVIREQQLWSLCLGIIIVLCIVVPWWFGVIWLCGLLV